jgi:hypothetical protein
MTLIGDKPLRKEFIRKASFSVIRWYPIRNPRKDKTMTTQPLCGFMHRRFLGRYHEAICYRCLVTVAIRFSPAALTEFEALHVCHDPAAMSK